MTLVRRLIRGLQALARPERADADLTDEISHYLDLTAEAHVARGLSAEAARRAARAELGNPLALREEVRASGWEHAWETMVLDIRFALRRLRTAPAFTATAVATVAIGIGASTAVFSALNPVLIEPLPFPHASRLVTLEDRNTRGAPMAATLGTYEELNARTRSFEALAAADVWRPGLSESGDPERLEGQRVTASYFEVFGAQPIAGRGFSAPDDRPGAPNLAIVSEGLAERRFGGTRSVVGRQIKLDGDPYTIIGVMPRGFANVLSPATEVWSTLRERATGDFGSREWGHHYELVGRLKPAASVEEASREVLALGRAPTPDFPRPPWANLETGLLVRPLQQTVAASARPALLAVGAAVLVLLGIACVNVVNLLLARGSQRGGEFALRVALGAGRRRLLRQVLTEGLVLAGTGGTLGLIVAQLGVHGLLAASPPGLPRRDAIRLDTPVFLFALVLAVLVGLVAGLVPALGVPRADVLQRSTRRMTVGRKGVRSTLVVAEISLALVLLVSAGLLFRSIHGLITVAPGFDPTNVVTLQVVESGHEFDSDQARLQFLDQVLEAVRGLPGVTSAAFTSQLPLSGEVDGYGFETATRPATAPGAAEDGSALRYAVTPGYFPAMGIPVLRGRALDASDRTGAPPTVVINEGLARELFGNRDPIGQRLRFGPEMGSDRPWREVVGVVGDVRHYSLAVAPPNAFYVASGQWGWVDNAQTLVVRATGPISTLVPSLKRTILSVNPNVPIPRVETMDGFIAATAGDRRFALLVIETFALAALLLAAVGLYGIVSGGVTERTREIGIRTALGATPGNVVGQVVGRALALTLAGAAVGVGGGLVASRLLASMLFGVSGLDPLTYGAVILLLVAVALLAAWEPARRAAGVSPSIALRAE